MLNWVNFISIWNKINGFFFPYAFTMQIQLENYVVIEKCCLFLNIINSVAIILCKSILLNNTIWKCTFSIEKIKLAIKFGRKTVKILSKLYTRYAQLGCFCYRSIEKCCVSFEKVPELRGDLKYFYRGWKTFHTSRS